MDQIFNIIAGWFWSILCLLVPIIVLDQIFLKGRFTKRLGQGLQSTIIFFIELPFRFVGATFRGLWRGLRDRKNRQKQQNDNQDQRIIIDINVNQPPNPPPNQP